MIKLGVKSMHSSQPQSNLKLDAIVFLHCISSRVIFWEYGSKY